jgi:hypothetical protein
VHSALAWVVALAIAFAGCAVARTPEDGQVAYDRRDYATALRIWTELADQGSATAQVRLGLMYARGHGVTRDDEAAVRWYRKAADQGYAWGETNLGYMYESGRGVTRSYAEAAVWYRKAAAQDFAMAQGNLGILYEHGRGVDKDDAEAARWYRKAAEQDYLDAQISLGQMYETGRGVPKDLAEAAAWYGKAAKKGSVRAKTFLASLENRGRPRVVAGCLAQIAEWPIRTSRNRLIVDGAVNGRKVGVLLDTGASRTMMLRSQALRLGLSPVELPRAWAEGVGGIAEVGAVTVREMMIGDATRTNWTMPVVADPDLGGDFAVVLGEDFFERVDVEFDLAHEVVRLYQAKGCGDAPLAYWAKDGATEVAFDTGYFRRPRIHLTVRLNGQPVKAILDSGAAYSLLDASIAARLGITPDTPGVRPAGSARGVGKETVQTWIAPVQSFGVGGETIRDTAIAFADTKSGNLLLGVDFLRAHRMLVSHSQNKLHFSYVGGPVFQLERLHSLQDEPLPVPAVQRPAGVP